MVRFGISFRSGLEWNILAIGHAEINYQSGKRFRPERRLSTEIEANNEHDSSKLVRSD